MSEILFGAGILSAIWGVVSSIAITSFLSGRGEKINYFLLRLLLFRYVMRYSEITTRENGKPGRWYYSYIVSMILALVLVAAGIIAKNV
ncbi:MAG: hypothetical protein MUF59_02035 [Candidatus Krumholzibacteria bacterium]|nr:hypothetical protein [Candidatus Krumholzibacteria bacterium]